MSALSYFFRSTIGRKQLVGVTGLGLSLFVLTHSLGNILIFCGAESYNLYSHAIISNPFLYVAEGGLILLFVMHLGLALKLSIENKMARIKGYATSASGEKGTSLVTKTMWHQGLVILIFVIFHLITFKYGPYYEATYGEVVVRDLHRLILEVFMDPIYVIGYIFALIALGIHLSHGVSSAIQTLGFNHPRYECKVKAVGFVFALVVALTFISQPLYVFLFKGLN